MEKVLCAAHGFPCLLKTGIKDGPNKGKSFYVCGVQSQPPCGFVLPTQLCPSHCLMHEEYVVDLQVLIQQQGTDQYRLFYRCAKCKEEGKKWCGSVPWQDSQPTKLAATPQSQSTLDVSLHQRDQRNPFKVPGKNQEPFSLKQINNYEDKKSKEEDKRKTLDSDKKNQQKLPLEHVGKEFPKESKIKFGDKISRSYRGEKERQTKSNDLTTDIQETVLLNTQKSSSKKTEVPSGHLRQNSSMRHTKGDLQKKETSCSSQTSSIKSLNEEQLGKGGSETCIDKRVTEKTHGDGGSEKRTVTPRGLVTVCEFTGLPTRFPREDPLLHSGVTVKEKQSTTENAGGCEHNRFVPCKSPVGLVVDSLHEKDCSKTNLPSISQGSAPSQGAEIPHSEALRSHLSAQLRQKKSTLKMVNMQALPDKGERLLKQVEELEAALNSLKLETEEGAKEAGIIRKEEELKHKPFSRTTTEPLSTLKGKGPQMFDEHGNTRPLDLHLPAGSNQYCSNPSGEYSSARNLYGGRMTEDRLRAVYNATTDAINQLHKSLKSCPTEEAVAVDPPGLKISLLLHQKQALAWLLWRENQTPCGGILADDMGLGKTLTMIALVLTQKQLQKEKGKEKKVEICLSQKGSSIISSNGTLIVCPASLIHHWKKEVERHVSIGKLRVSLYHGPNRIKNTVVLSGYDIVITTYSILGKEIPTHKEEAEVSAKDHVVQDKSLPSSPLLWINWGRIILDEAHNIRNPKVQASIAACKLRATARWAVTGTPIQNNLLDMYSLLRFLRCSPFDEFKVWKSQVDNNTRKGGERLAILTRSLLLRRTKDQLDSSGKPLVLLPQRLTRLHRLKLSGDEQSVYDVLFTRSRSTLQSYLKRQEAQLTERTGDNPFERVAQEFRDGHQGPVGKTNADTPPVSTTVHILSLLLRLRQCCCHLSLLKVALEQASLDSEGISLSLEEQLSAMTLSDPDSSDPRSTVYLLGSPFGVDLFERTRQSTKLSHLLEELKAIKDQSQKSVIVSQWTSMLKVVAVHLEKLGLKYATVDGSVNPKLRMDVVEEFNSNPKGPQVMLISLLAGGVGLNLVGGNHLFLLDMHWNPALEDQACDRIYRVGQKKDVVIHRFICEGTVEETISELQATKKELAQKVLLGRGDSFTKLTLADLKLLFGM